MKCDHCDKPAVVHETVIKNGEKKEIHLCQAHAASVGYLPDLQPLDKILANFSPTAKKTAASPACATCGMTLAQFRQHGNLGCEACYSTFEKMLEPLIERAHAGGTRHVGRSPRRSAERIDLRELRMKLVRELDEAVAAEQYERAARLRDRLHGLGEGGAASAAEPASE